MPEVGPVHLMPSFYSFNSSLQRKDNIIVTGDNPRGGTIFSCYDARVFKAVTSIGMELFCKDTKLLAEEFETDSSSAEIKERNLMIYRTIPSDSRLPHRNTFFELESGHHFAPKHFIEPFLVS